MTRRSRGSAGRPLSITILVFLFTLAGWLFQNWSERAGKPSLPKKPTTSETTREEKPVAETIPELETIAGFASHVKDGDTLVMQVGQEEKTVRFWGIDAPEGSSRQPFAQEARDLARSLCQRRKVQVRIHDTDRFGRVVGEVLLEDGTNVNQRMVEAGLAWHYVQHAPSERILADLQEEARESGRGLWSDSKPVPPWEWRKLHPPPPR